MVEEKTRGNWVFDRSALDISEVVDHVPVGIGILGVDLKFELMNKALEILAGVGREEAIGVPCQYIMRSNLCVKKCPAKEVLRTGQTVRTEGDIINRARQKVPVMMTMSPLKDAGGRIIGLIEAVEDLSLVRELDKQIHTARDFGDMVGSSPRMQKVFDILPAIAQTGSSVLITGETGTGKDLIAAVIHRLSRRAQGPFIKVNCGALPVNLLESELFGHKRGAFTGAVRDKPGRFQLAESGTIYLTEIGDLYLPLQVKLLTVLDDKEVYPVGATKSVKADVRVIAATHRDLETMVKRGEFREDLLFRLNVVRIDVPPLRERGEDIRLLMEHFLNHFKKEFQKDIKGFSKKAIDVLIRYPCPGNVRELKNIVEYAANMCHQGTIQVEHLPGYLRDQPLRAATSDVASKIEEKVQAEREETHLPGEAGQVVDWKQMERRMIAEALLQARGNRSRAAKFLGWGRSTLWRKMKQYGLA